MTDLSYIVRVAVTTVAIASLSIVFTFEGGLFNPLVDNKMIFSLIAPAFQTVIGAFVGFLSALAIRKEGP